MLRQHPCQQHAAWLLAKPTTALSAVLHTGHNSRGSGPDWFLEMVEVEDVASGAVYYCACNAWLGPKEGQGLCERTLQAATVDPRPPKKTYQVHHLAGHASPEHLLITRHHTCPRPGCCHVACL